MQTILVAFVFCLTLLYSSAFDANIEVSNECDCSCSDTFGVSSSVCKRLSRYEKELFTVVTEIEKRTKYIKEIRELNERVDFQELLVESLLQQVEDLRKANKRHEPAPEFLIIKPEDQMQGDSSQITRTTENEKDLAKNVSSLLAKVKVVENITSQVQEELQTERRVRRHLEEDLNETRSSIKILDDKLQNVTIPMDERAAYVEEIVLATMENINKTLFENHLQKLYYRVDGVVYKNETKKLDERLDQVETELHDVSNSTLVSKLSEELKILANAVGSVFENMTSKESRLSSLETKTKELEEVKEMKEQIAMILNTTELLQSEISFVKLDVQSVRNNSMQVKNEMNNLASQSAILIESVKHNASQLVEKLNSEVSAVRSDISKEAATMARLKSHIIALDADVTTTKFQMKELAFSSNSKLVEMKAALTNLADIWNGSFAEIYAQVEELKSSKKEEHFVKLVTESPTDGVPSSEKKVGYLLVDEDNYADEISYRESERTNCSLPIVNDTNLLVTLQIEEDGRQNLGFGCRPVGAYVLHQEPQKVRCLNGVWHGKFPTCLALLNESEIAALSEKIFDQHPCRDSVGDTPDPSDCNHFFKCWQGMSEWMSCPQSMHFNAQSKICDFPSKAKCLPLLTEEEIRLRNLIPTIHVTPDNIDRPHSMKGTYGTGTLVVFPGTSFDLECLYPDNRFGTPAWYVERFHLQSQSPFLTSSFKFENRVTMKVVSASRVDSGIYTCRTPFGKQNSISVVVEAVKCPPVQTNSTSPMDVFYRPPPFGESRILTTTVEFSCENKPPITAVCTADGTWSRPVPTAEECPQKPNIWGCPPIHTKAHPNLVLDRDDSDWTITFRCTGNMRLLGNALTRCYDGTWTHSELPHCVPRRV